MKCARKMNNAVINKKYQASSSVKLFILFGYLSISDFIYFLPIKQSMAKFNKNSFC